MSALTEREKNILEAIKIHLGKELSRQVPEHFNIGNDQLCMLLTDYGLLQREVYPKTGDVGATRYYLFRRIDTPPKENT